MAATDVISAQPFDPVSRDIRTGVYRGHVVTYEVIDGLAIWDGDIILGTPEELSPKHVPETGITLDSHNKISAVSSKERLWPGGIIPYVIDPELTNPHVHDAILYWNKNTVTRLVSRTDQPNWVRFRPGSNCSASVGMIGGEQIVILRESCLPGAIVHEIGHAVGLWHEHERSDRDSHVWARSHPLGRVDGFFYYGKDGPYAVASGPYDYGSVMHYRWIGPLETIPPGIEIGRGGPKLGRGSSRGLSAGDIDGINRLYGTIPTKTTVSANVAGLLIEVDGETYSAPHRFDWAPGSTHTIGVVSPQVQRPYPIFGSDYHLRYLFAKWSDGGAQTHTVTASSETTVFIANFILQMRPKPSADPPEGGTVRLDPPSPGGFYPRLSFLKAIAEPSEGFSFERWRSWYVIPIDGGFSSNPALDRVRHSYPALFTRRPLTTIDTNEPRSKVLVDGSQILLPASFGWAAGSTHTLGLDGSIGAGEVQFFTSDELGHGRLIFNGWSDGGDATHDITVSVEPTTITANFTRQFSLQTVSHGPGTIEAQPSGSGGRYHDLSTTVQLTARPARGFKFVSWLGDLSGSENPQSLLMDSEKWVRAFFLDEHTFESARLTSGKPFNLLFDPGAASAEEYNGYWIDVPPGATQLDIRLVTATPGAEVDLYARRDIRPSAMFDENTEELIGYESQHSATGPGGDETITITPASNPPLEPGPYFIAVHAGTQEVSVQGNLTAEVTAAESVIAANVPAYSIPASVITTIEGEIPAPQSLEIRNSGRGTLEYQIDTDQSWLSVRPDQGSSAGETDTVEITVNPSNLRPGAFEGAITITERQPAGDLDGVSSDPTPTWPVTVPVTLIVIPDSREPPPVVAFSTYAGWGLAIGDEGPAVIARLNSPNDVAVDAAGYLYIADYYNHRIRRVNPSGIITTIAGSGEQGFSGDGGPAVEAMVSAPKGVAVDTAGNLYIADSFNQRIRRVDPSGIISTVAGSGERGFAGDGGPAVEAQLAGLSGVAVDTAGNLYIADSFNNRIRRVDPSGTISTFAGTGERGFAGDSGPAVEARLSYPSSVAVDADGNLYIADSFNNRIRRVDPSGIISTVAGTGAYGFSGDGGPAVEALLAGPSGLAMDADGNLYFADQQNQRIRRVDPSGIISTVAGTGERGFGGDSGPAVEARLDGPRGVALDASVNLYITDAGNQRIRKVDPSGTITTVAGK